MLLFAACSDYGAYSFTAIQPDVHPDEVTECGFTPVESSDFFSYDCNPVFETSGEQWAPEVGATTFHVTEVLGHAWYQMWYVGVPSEESQGDYALGYAVSDDGTHWTSHTDNPQLSSPSADAWDSSGMDAMQIVRDPVSEQYVMLYQGYNLNSSEWGLGVATSVDGRDFTRLPLNPVVDLSAGDGPVQGWCWPLGLTLGEVAGFTGYISGYDRSNGACEVYTIAAGDLTQWRPRPDKVLAAGPAGQFDDEGMISIAIAELDGERHMFYVGFGDWEERGSYRVTRSQYLGHATSTDGKVWNKQGVIPIHRTTDGLINTVAAHTVGDRIHLWVTDDYDGHQAVGYFLYDPRASE
ncbi:MAG: hypothetical protein ACI9MC_001853 [Kiritimatiellia bacterium]|jgi:hypothetical protein